ncbi:MAG: UPF0175 family protein [Chitinophagaceae bacterium]
MKTLTIQIPDSLDERETKTVLAVKLFEKGTLSLGQAAEMAGYTKRTFMEILGDYNVSLFNYTAKDLDKDIMNAKNYHL